MSITDPDKNHNVKAGAATAIDTPDTNSSVKEVDDSPETAVGSEGSNSAQVSLAKSSISKMKLCGVCNEREGKYKCSRCYLQYCSVACSTLHKATHPATELTQAAKPKPDPPSKHNGAIPKAGTKAAAGFKGPFAALDDSEELKTLFKMYPRLPSQLDEINQATLRPIDEPGMDSPFSRGKGRGRKEEPWNQDRGMQNGVQALCQAREAGGRDGEGIREFGKLILQILSRDEALDAAALIEKELAEENAWIVQQLLNGEP